MAEPRTSLAGAVSRLRRRARQAAFLGELSRHGTVALLLAGTAALLLRLLLGLSTAAAAPVLGLVLLAPLTAWLSARRRFLSASGAAAWLDVRSGSTGLLVTGLELADGPGAGWEPWRERAAAALSEAPRPPGLRVERLGAPLLPAAAFAAAGLWLGLPAHEPGPPPGLFEAAVDRLTEKLETLEETVELEEELAEELRARLEHLAEEADAARPETTFEALDALEQRLEAEAFEAFEAAREAREGLAAAAEEAVRDGGEAAAQERLERTLAELAESGFAGEYPESIQELLGAEGLALPEGAQLDASQLLELSEELQQLLADRLADLQAAGLLKPGQLGELALAGELADIELVEHECGEECEAGGT